MGIDCLFKDAPLMAPSMASFWRSLVPSKKTLSITSALKKGNTRRPWALSLILKRISQNFGILRIASSVLVALGNGTGWGRLCRYQTLSAWTLVTSLRKKPLAIFGFSPISLKLFLAFFIFWGPGRTRENQGTQGKLCYGCVCVFSSCDVLFCGRIRLFYSQPGYL